MQACVMRVRRSSGRWRRARWGLWAAGLLALGADAAALDIVSYYSPRNGERARRRRTDYIILHTTEGPAAGSLRKVYENGETHFLVDPAGKVYRIIHWRRVALHAGQSMWDGRTDLDQSAIGIEVVGYHDRDIASAQYAAVKELLSDLQHHYGIPDERVLTHSMVAYGTANRWHPSAHRGRKRCGMLFANPSVRLRLGLERQPFYDPDVRARRLVVGDPALARALYGSARYQSVAAAGVPPSSGTAASASPPLTANGRAADGVAGPGSRAVGRAGELKEIGRDGRSAKEIAGRAVNSRGTIYFLRNGGVKRGDELSASQLASLPAGTRMLAGYVYGGAVTAKRSAFDVCGNRWNDPSTFYRLSSGVFVSGSRLKEAQIPKGALIFFKY